RSPADEIRAVLSTYVHALETRDLALLRRVQPGLTEDDLQKIRASFDQSSSIKVDLKPETIEISGGVARVRGRRLDVVVGKDSRPTRYEARFAFVLVKTSAGWHIQRTND